MTTLFRRAMNALALFALALAASAPGAVAQTATLAKDIATQEIPYLFVGTNFLHPLGQSLFFVNTSEDAQPWVTDGTAYGSRMLADTCPAPCYGAATEILGTLGDRLVYLRGQIWSTDGTPAGTVTLTEPALQIGEYNTPTGVRLGDRIYFRACQYDENDDIACAVWSTDGTRAGTGPVPV